MRVFKFPQNIPPSKHTQCDFSMALIPKTNSISIVQIYILQAELSLIWEFFAGSIH